MRGAGVACFPTGRNASERSMAIVRLSCARLVRWTWRYFCPWIVTRRESIGVLFTLRFVLFCEAVAGTTDRFCSYAIHEPHLSSVLSSRAKKERASSIWINSLIHENASNFIIFSVSLLVNCRYCVPYLSATGKFIVATSSKTRTYRAGTRELMNRELDSNTRPWKCVGQLAIYSENHVNFPKTRDTLVA